MHGAPTCTLRKAQHTLLLLLSSLLLVSYIYIYIYIFVYLLAVCIHTLRQSARAARSRATPEGTPQTFASQQRFATTANQHLHLPPNIHIYIYIYIYIYICTCYTVVPHIYIYIYIHILYTPTGTPAKKTFATTDTDKRTRLRHNSLSEKTPDSHSF